MAATDTKKEQSEHFAEACRNMFECSFQAGFDCAVKKAYDLLNKNLSRCVECYVDDEVTTRLKEDVLEDFKREMEK